MNSFLKLIKKDERDKMMKVRKILFACIIGGVFLMFLLLKYNPRNNRAYLENRIGISLPKEKYFFEDITDWDSYLKEIMAEIELRIPDEYLKAKGWL